MLYYNIPWTQGVSHVAFKVRGPGKVIVNVNVNVNVNLVGSSS